MDKKNIKHIVAREGLIILGNIVLLVISFMISGKFPFNNFLNSTLPLLSFCLYPIYLVIRFIIWALNTLRGTSGLVSLRKLLARGSTFIFWGLVILLVYYYRYQHTQYPIDLVESELRYNEPKSWLESEKGDIAIIGWKVKRTGKPNTFLVSYTYRSAKDAKFQEFGWWWEVNTKEKFTRKVVGDEELERKYGLSSAPKIESKESIRIMDDKINEWQLKEQKKAKWRKLETGMRKSQVLDILGEPERITGSGSVWYYPNGGVVKFWDWLKSDTDGLIKNFGNGLQVWEEPRWE